MADVTSFLLSEAGVALVPFYAFGASHDSPWFRLSVGTVRAEDIPGIIANLRRALKTLN
jgi:aspartate aminotransferase